MTTANFTSVREVKYRFRRELASLFGACVAYHYPARIKRSVPAEYPTIFSLWIFYFGGSFQFLQLLSVSVCAEWDEFG